MDLLVGISGIVCYVALCFLIADFISGFFHWLEDSYGSPDWPLLGPQIIAPNILHHFDPRHMTHHSWLASTQAPLAIMTPIVIAVFAAGAMTWQLGLIALLVVNANEIHKWAHRGTRENNRVIQTLQRAGIFQSPKEHARHHAGRKDSRYCTLTNYLNPVLETLRFWRRLERAIQLLTGVGRRVDPSISPDRRSYAVPACNNAACERARIAKIAWAAYGDHLVALGVLAPQPDRLSEELVVTGARCG